MEAHKIKWKLEVVIEVTENWVEDGFEATPERIEEGLRNMLPWAHSHEIKIKAKTIEAPNKKLIAKIQGY